MAALTDTVAALTETICGGATREREQIQLPFARTVSSELLNLLQADLVYHGGVSSRACVVDWLKAPTN